MGEFGDFNVIRSIILKWIKVKVKVNQSRYRPEVAQKVRGS